MFVRLLKVTVSLSCLCPLQDILYSLPFRPPEFFHKFDLATILSSRCDSWAAGVTLLEAGSGHRLFDGSGDLKVAKQIQDYVEECSTGINATMKKKLFFLLNSLDETLKKPICSLLKSSPENRASCSFQGWA